MQFVAVIFVVGVAVAIPPRKLENDECLVAQESEQCFDIFTQALQPPQNSGMKEIFQHYCRGERAYIINSKSSRNIHDFIPCLKENEADYEAMSRVCPDDEMFISAIVTRLGHIMTWGEMFNITIDFIDTANDIVCTRSDEIANLVNCLSRRDTFQPLLSNCAEEHYAEVGEKLGENEEVPVAEICSSTYGFTTCMKDGFINACGSQYSDLLDTVYYDIVEDIFGEGFGCEESTPLEPLLDFARSVRNLYRK